MDAVARRYRLENGNSLGEKDEVDIVTLLIFLSVNSFVYVPSRSIAKKFLAVGVVRSS